MRKFRWDVAQMVICAGAVCIAIGFASNLVEVAYAQCANKKVRPNSPCLTQLKTCTEFKNSVGVLTSCGGSKQDVSFGNFQCDLESTGTYCAGTGSFAACYTEGPCKLTPTQPGFPDKCAIDPKQAQSYTQETQWTYRCPG